MAGLAGLLKVGEDVYLGSNLSLSVVDLAHVQQAGGDLVLHGSQLRRFSFDELSTVGGDVMVSYNTQLTTLGVEQAARAARGACQVDDLAPLYHEGLTIEGDYLRPGFIGWWGDGMASSSPQVSVMWTRTRGLREGMARGPQHSVYVEQTCHHQDIGPVEFKLDRPAWCHVVQENTGVPLVGLPERPIDHVTPDGCCADDDKTHPQDGPQRLHHRFESLDFRCNPPHQPEECHPQHHDQDVHPV